MISAKFIDVFEKSKKDDRNITSKKNLAQFIEDNYFNGTVREVYAGTSVTRYDIEVKPKAIKYFLKLEREFNSDFTRTENMYVWKFRTNTRVHTDLRIAYLHCRRFQTTRINFTFPWEKHLTGATSTMTLFLCPICL